MKKRILATSLLALIPIAAHAEGIQITPNASAPSILVNPQQFAGHAVVAPLFPANEFTQGSGGHVTFAPGARTAWHTHPAGQILIVTSGKGWVREEGQPKREIAAGDVVWISPGVNHWHGATATSGMSHIALSYVRDGSNVTWGRLVTDQEFTN